MLGCLALAISCSRHPGQFPESTSAEQEAFLLRLEAVQAEVQEAKRTADRELGKAGNLILTFDSMGRKGVAEQARKRFREQREQIERPAREKWKRFLKEIEGLAVHGWYGRIERLPLGTRSEMRQPRCEIASGRVKSEGPVAESRLYFYCRGNKPIERFGELAERDWVYFSGVILRERSKSDLAAMEIDFELTDVEKAGPP